MQKDNSVQRDMYEELSRKTTSIAHSEFLVQKQIKKQKLLNRHSVA